MPNLNQFQYFASFAEVDAEKLLAAARRERAKMVRAFLANVFRRQAKPAYC